MLVFVWQSVTLMIPGVLSAAERALYSVLSPPELLDRHLAQGSELHAKELAHIPLTSKENVSWTHFGGQSLPVVRGIGAVMVRVMAPDSSP